MKRPVDKVLRPVHANVGMAAEYRAKLDKMIEEMTRSYARWIVAQYRKTPPKIAQDIKVAGKLTGPLEVRASIALIAQDASPAKEIEREINNLGRRWKKQFKTEAPKLGKWFSQKIEKRSREQLFKILHDAGMTVEFKMTAAMQDVLQASVAENVSLIRSIAEQYHGQIEQLVMRSVTTGRDLASLSKELEARYGVTKRRAAFIARDQNNKMTAVFTRVRQEQAGIEEAIWLHSHGGREPRPTHLANSGNKYKVSEGWYDPDPKVRRFIRPGELINCRCVSKPIVKGFK